MLRDDEPGEVEISNLQGSTTAPQLHPILLTNFPIPTTLPILVLFARHEWTGEHVSEYKSRSLHHVWLAHKRYCAT